MNLWYQQMLTEAQAVCDRFAAGTPTNQFEEIIFGAVRALMALAAAMVVRRLTRAV